MEQIIVAMICRNLIFSLNPNTTLTLGNIGAQNRASLSKIKTAKNSLAY